MRPDYSLTFFEKVRPDLQGNIVKLEAQRGIPEILFNTKLFTDKKEEVWLSGFTCGKQHLGTLKLMELITMLDWHKQVPIEEIERIVLNNNSFRMEFYPHDPSKKVLVIKPNIKLWTPNGNGNN